MFFDSLDQVPHIAEKTACSIFVLPHPEKITIKNASLLTPDEGKKTISVEEVRDFTKSTAIKSDSTRFLLINPADALTPGAGNALLKNLEEPKENYHYILATAHLGALLPTIRSRAHTYFLRIKAPLDSPLEAPKNVATLARELITASPRDLPTIADKITKANPNSRLLADEVCSTAIEILEKSYFKTGRPEFLAKLEKFINLAAALAQNGHVKLHIVADLC